MDTEKIPKRSQLRFIAGLNTALHVRGEAYACEAENLSRGGALLFGVIPWPVEPRIVLTLESARGDLKLRCDAVVVRREQGEGADVRIGVEFDRLDDTRREVLEALVSRVIEGSVPAPLAALKDDAPPAEIRVALERVSLPHRIALAARAQLRERGMLFVDSSPQVLEALARNPSLTWNEIRPLVARHELLPTTLQAILRDPRWTRDDDIRIAVATHSRVTLQLAREAVSALNEMAIQKLLRRPGLHPTVRNDLINRATNSRRKFW